VPGTGIEHALPCDNQPLRLNNKMSMKIEIIVEKTKTGYSAYAEKYPVYTVGKSLSELKSNILEAVNLLW
jgi:hypothetical protein